MLTHTYFLCNINKEPDRYQSLQEQIDSIKLDNYSFFTFIWGDEVTREIRNMYCKTDTSMRLHGRNMIDNPLKNTEISLFLNHIECLRVIRKNYNKGYFAIFESDALFYENYLENVDKLMRQTLEYQDIDMINIGEGWRDHFFNNYLLHRPLKNDIGLYKVDSNKFTEGMIWSYNGLCKFLDHFETTLDIDAPIDCRIEIFRKISGTFHIYWSWPSLVYQGTISGKFTSRINY